MPAFTVTSELHLIGTYDEIIESNAIYICDRSKPVTPETLSSFYAQRGNQIKLSKVEFTLTDELDTLIYSTPITTPEQQSYYDKLLLFESAATLGNAGYILLHEQVTKEYAENITFKILVDKTKLNIAKTPIDNVPGDKNPYKSVNEQNQIHFNYRGVDESLQKELSTLKVVPFLGGLAELKDNNYNIFNIIDKIPLYTLPTTKNILNIDIYVNKFRQVEELFELYLDNQIAHIIKYPLFNYDSNHKLTEPTSVVEPISSTILSQFNYNNIFIYRNGIIGRSKSDYKLYIVYYEYPTDIVKAENYYINEIDILIKSDDYQSIDNLPKDLLPDINRYLPSLEFISYFNIVNRVSEGRISVNGKSVSIPFDYGTIYEMGSKIMLFKTTNLGKWLITNNAHTNVVNYVKANRHSSFPLNGLSTAFIYNKLVAYSGLFYIMYNNYLYLL